MKFLAQYSEALLAFILGAVFFLVKKPELAYVSLIIGPSLTASRFLLSKKIDEEIRLTRSKINDESELIQSKIDDEMSQIRKLAGIFDLYIDLPVDKLRDIIKAYLRVEPEFRQVKETILSEAAEKLFNLSQLKRSDLLTTSNYYNWLLPQLEEAPIGSDIWAISMMLDFEWDDSPFEEKFLALNMKAAMRGVRLERIFVVNRNDLSKMATNPGVIAHMANTDSTLIPLIVFRELVTEREPSLLEDAGDGMIAFDRRVALIDRSSPHGIRGYLTTNEGEISKLRQTYEKLRTFAWDMKPMLASVEIDNSKPDGTVSAKIQPETAFLKIQSPPP